MDTICRNYIFVLLRYRRKVCLLICLLLVAAASLYGQTENMYKPNFISLGIYRGYFQVHTESLSGFRGAKPWGVELEYSQMLLSEKVKHRFGIFPKWGLAFNYVDFDHSSLGHSFNGLVYVEPFLKAQGSWQFSVKIGGGLAYMTHPYSKKENFNNKTYSTNLAFPLLGGASVYYFFNKQWAVKSTASFRHISNGESTPKSI